MLLRGCDKEDGNMNKNRILSSFRGAVAAWRRKAVPKKRAAMAAVAVLLLSAAMGGSIVLSQVSSDPTEAEAMAVVAAEPTESWSILAGGSEIARLASEEDAQAVLDQVKAAYVTEGAELVEVTFAQDVLVTRSAVGAAEGAAVKSTGGTPEAAAPDTERPGEAARMRELAEEAAVTAPDVPDLMEDLAQLTAVEMSVAESSFRLALSAAEADETIAEAAGINPDADPADGQSGRPDPSAEAVGESAGAGAEDADVSDGGAAQTAAQEELPILTVEEAVSLILTGSREPKTYVVQGGDTLWDIALANDLSPYELMEMNPGVADRLSIGQELNLYQVKPYVTVRTREIVVAEERIEYAIQYESSADLYKGQSQVQSPGSYGSQSVRSEVIKENGLVVAATVLESTVLQEPVTQVTLVGTKAIPLTAGTGQLAVPVTNIEISSGFGSRGGGRHLGVDLRMPKGSPIMAADSGTVTKAVYSGSFGNLIVINHGNGIETYYSHCNTMAVTVGQAVTKGDVIGTVGATGNATGYHLHFEVRVNGVAQNPVNYF